MQMLRWSWRGAIALAVVSWIGGNIEPTFAADLAAASPEISDQTALLADSPWQWILLTFTTVFVAEMGDKTQLATMLMSAKEKSPWSIFLGSASALVAASAVSVLLGDWLSKFIPPELLQLVAGASFVVIGLYVLWQETVGDPDAEREPSLEGMESDGGDDMAADASIVANNLSEEGDRA